MKKIIFFAFVGLIFIQSNAQEKPFAQDIQKFQQIDKTTPPKKDIILFIGSSTFTIWGDNTKKDLKNENILNRAFGGSTLLDLLRYKKEILFAYQPKKIVIYCGENDIANEFPKVKAQEVLRRFQELHKEIRTQFPTIPVIYVSMKPSFSRWEMRDEMQEANKLIEAYLKKQPNNYFIYIWDKLLDKSKKPNSELYLEDKLHLNKKGYEILTKELDKYVN